MEASEAPAISPSSDDRLWRSLRDLVDSNPENREAEIQPSASSRCRMESERRKRLREGSQLLIRGFDSISSCLSHLSSTLTTTRQKWIFKYPSLERTWKDDGILVSLFRNQQSQSLDHQTQIEMMTMSAFQQQQLQT